MAFASQTHEPPAGHHGSEYTRERAERLGGMQFFATLRRRQVIPSVSVFALQQGRESVNVKNGKCRKARCQVFRRWYKVVKAHDNLHIYSLGFSTFGCSLPLQ